MKTEKYNPAKQILSAATDKKVLSSRIYARRPDGNIGVTAWYVSDESIEALKEEIIAAGHEIVRIEKKLI